MLRHFLWSLLAAIFCLTSLNSEEPAPSEVMKEAYPELMSQPELSRIEGLVQKANLVNFFNGSGPFTVFAPTNTAFDQMDQKLLANLQKPENLDELIGLINYHVILGEYPSANLKTKSYRTVNGKEIQVRVENGEIWVNDANVLKKDIKGKNGTCYIIDKVLIP